LNLCQPDSEKSCAACCGLYNVRDGTRETLQSNLVRRTELFKDTERSMGAIVEFESYILSLECLEPIEPEIHTCAYIGFIDERFRCPGCMLHPANPDNRGVDYRGLCHYGSLACRSFYCPAWESLEPEYRTLVAETVDDWHLYGLVATDLDFVRSVMSLIESLLGFPPVADRLVSGPAGDDLRAVLALKGNSEHAGGSPMRKSRYYCKASAPCKPLDDEACFSAVADCISLTYGSEHRQLDRESELRDLFERLVSRY
jgi:hypothetical protein